MAIPKVQVLNFRFLIHFELKFVVSLFCMWISSFVAPFAEKTTLFPLHILGIFVSRLAVGMWAYF